MTSGTEAKKLALKNRLVKNLSLGLTARIYYLATRFILTPITLSYLTLDEYGIWAACFILISYMGMSSFGIANVYIRYVAEYSAKNEQEKINKLVTTGLLITTLEGIVLMGGLIACLPWVVQMLKIPPALRHTSSILIVATAASFLLDLSLGVFANILSGLQQIAESNIVWVVTVTIEVVVAVVLLHLGCGVYALAWAFGLRYLISTILMIIYCYKLMPGLSIRWRYFDRANLKLFFGYGSIVQIAGVLGTFMYTIEKVIAGMFVGVGATGLFDIGEKFPVMGSQLAGAMNGIFMPALTHMNTLTWKDEVVKLYLKGARYLNMMTGTLMGFLLAFAGPLLHFWIGPSEKFGIAEPILMIFCLPYQMHVLTGSGSAFHRGVGKPVREMLYPISQFLLVVLFVVVGFAWHGRTILVIAAADGLAVVLSGLLYMAYSNRVIGVPQWQFALHALAPGILPYFFGLATRWGTSSLFVWAGMGRPRLAVAIVVSAVCYSAFVFPVLYRGFCPWGEREYLRKQALHTLGTLLPRSGA